MRRADLVTTAILAVLAFAVPGVTSAEQHDYPRWSLTSSRGIQFDLAPAAEWEINVPIVCEIKKGGVILRPAADIGYSGDTVLDHIVFQLVEVDQGGLIALVEKSNPDVVLLLVSSSDTVIWSKVPADYVPWDKWIAVGESMLDVLKRKEPSRTYVLGVKVPGSRRLLVAP